MDCRGVYDALTRSESAGLGLKDKRAGLEALALRQSMGRTKSALRWCHSQAQLADMMTKNNASTTETWYYFQNRGSWRLIYDPEFTSAKNRAKKGLKIIEDGALYITRSGMEFPVCDFNAAWILFADAVAEFSTTFLEEDPKDHDFYNRELISEMRRIAGIN